MGPTRPQDVALEFSTALAEGDLPRALACFEPGASLYASPERLAKGTDAVESILATWIGQRARLHVQAPFWTPDEAEETALLYSRWSLEMPAVPAPLMGVGVEVVRKGADGRWRYLLHDLWGAFHLPV